MTDHVDALKLDAYVEGELTPGVRLQVEAHLAACPRCARLAERLRRPADLLRSLAPESPPEGLSHRIIRRVARRKFWLGQRVAVWSSAAAIIGAALVSLSWSQIGAALANASAAANWGAWNVTLARLMEVPLEILSTTAGGTLAWESAMAETVGVGLVLGLVLLTVVSFVWLARTVGSTALRQRSGQGS